MSAPFTPAIVAEGVRHTFGEVVALDGLDLEVEAGTVFGPAGAVMSIDTHAAPERRHLTIAETIADSRVMAARQLRKVMRRPMLVVFAFVQPVMFVLLFRYVLGGAIDTGNVNYVDFLLPGIIVQTAIFGALMTGIGLAEDLSTGVVDRFRSLPVARSAMLVGRTAADVIMNVLTLVLMVLVGVAIGFRPSEPVYDLVLALALVLGFSYVFSWISAFIGLSVGDPETASSAGLIWVFPLTSRRRRSSLPTRCPGSCAPSPRSTPSRSPWTPPGRSPSATATHWVPPSAPSPGLPGCWLCSCPSRSGPSGGPDLGETRRTGSEMAVRISDAMAGQKMHDDEVDTGVDLVGRLLAAQFPLWADLPLRPVPSAGTDNALYRLGDDMVVRLPRIHWAVGQVEKEYEWLPRLARDLPRAIPVPVGKGEPEEGYPWHWSIYLWLDGETPTVAGLADPDLLALDLADFVTAMGRIDPAEGPLAGAHNFFRGVPLAARDTMTRTAIEDLRRMVDTDAVTAAWDAALQAPEWPGPPAWVHGDLAPGNLLIVDGRLNAVIDFGGLGVGDPAVDVMVAWNLLPPASRSVFRDALRVDDATWARGRGWALSVAVVALPYYRSRNPPLAASSLRVVDEVLNEARP